MQSPQPSPTFEYRSHKVFELREKAIIVGSAPKSLELGLADLSDYHKIAVNKAWRIRRDFDTHVFLQSLNEEDRPPLTTGMRPVAVKDFTPALRSAGGLYLTSGSVSMVAGYWAVATQGLHFISYYGCDLVFSSEDSKQSHYYGSGDTGPLVGNFQYNLRQRERSIRLLCWGLLHGTIITNGSALDGTLLAFPKCTLHVESNVLLDDILSSKETLRLIRKATNVWTYELSQRTPAFRERQKIFENDPASLGAMNGIMDAWLELEPFVHEFSVRVEALFNSSAELAASGRTNTPSDQLSRQTSEFDLVLHIGVPTPAAPFIQDALVNAGQSEQGCKVVPIKELKKYYTKTGITFAQKSEKDFSTEQRNIQIAKNFAKRLFEQLEIKPGERVIIHEEGAIGNIANCAYSGHLFRKPNKLLSNFAANLPVEPSEIHVSIMNYADFFAHAYLMLLNDAQSDRFLMPETMVAKVMAIVPSWIETLEGVKLCFPHTKVNVWPVDTDDKVLPDMVQSITGLAHDPDDWDGTDRSAAARGSHIDTFMNALRRMGCDAALEVWKHIQADEPESYTPFDPWAAPQRAHLDTLYKRDLVQIAGDERLILHGSVQADIYEYT